MNLFNIVNDVPTPGRIEAICGALEAAFEFEEPNSAMDADLGLCHTKGHIQYVKQHNALAYTVAMLVVGGAIKAAELACDGSLPSGLTDLSVTTPAQTPAEDSAISITWRSPLEGP